MKIMITGDKGQLGADCTRVLGEAHDVFGVDIDEVDIAKLPDIEWLVQQFGPNIIVNCAAYTRVDDCETEKELAWKANVTGAENLAKCVDKYGARLIHISTDYVFDGRKKVPEPYVETDEPNPISYYGITKLKGEEAVKRETDRYVTLRTAWLYGISGYNFLKTMLKLSLKNSDNKIKVVNDQFGSPTWTYRLALQIETLIETDFQGTFHATSEGYCSWYELADYFLKKMDVPHTVIPCTTEEYPTLAVRPMNSILENRHLKEKGMNIMTHWKSDVDNFVLNFRDVLLKETEKDT
ncbi:MAG: dTDP-4-dehydrorhamnose reductase [Deltaproteobacteria bacterium]|jgi:dTDP-4-dehydrorhamnose reductase|nr:dTDP-4-dehydrorhamnose reductase [Deltaproteobacteria bacterium]